jgi:UDP-2,3-diacylglucosamine pyrophosphatase LpxH
MSMDKAETKKRLNALLGDRNTRKLPLAGKKYAIFSDTHLGDGGRADDFRDNEGAFKRALDHYYKNKFSLILLGDIEELWQFDLDEITRRYDKIIYQKIRKFPADHVHRVFGNHDIDWQRHGDPTSKKAASGGSAGIEAVEALKLHDGPDKRPILLVHGHQGSRESDKSSWFSRIWVRAYRHIEPVLKLDPPTSATKSRITTDYEQIMYAWAKSKRVMLICGHSHRAIFASTPRAAELEEGIHEIQAKIQANRENEPLVVQLLQELSIKRRRWQEEFNRNRDIEALDPVGKLRPYYFNTGCGTYTDGMTAIEIADGEIRLVKWHQQSVNGKPRKEFKKRPLDDVLKEL